MPSSRGYIRASQLREVSGDITHRINALKAPVFSRPDIKSGIKMLLPFNAQISAKNSLDHFIKIGRGQYVHSLHTTPINTYESDFVSLAEGFRGLPYIWGGNSSEGMDCSGLVMMVLNACGHACPRNSGEQRDYLGQEVSLNAPLKRGDLIFWKGHVGVMRNEFDLLHANAHHMMTWSEPLNEAAHRINKSYGPIITIKRL